MPFLHRDGHYASGARVRLKTRLLLLRDAQGEFLHRNWPIVIEFAEHRPRQFSARFYYDEDDVYDVTLLCVHVCYFSIGRLASAPLFITQTRHT